MLGAHEKSRSGERPFGETKGKGCPRLYAPSFSLIRADLPLRSRR